MGGISTIFFVGVGVLGGGYLFSVIESFCSSSFQYLTNPTDQEQVNEHLIAMRSVAPVWSFHIQCYHYETRIHTDANGKMTTTQHRVNTWFASKQFFYHAFEDRSPPVPYFDSYLFTKFKTKLNVTFGDQYTESQFAQQKNIFIATNRRDTHYDFHETVKVITKNAIFFYCL